MKKLPGPRRSLLALALSACAATACAPMDEEPIPDPSLEDTDGALRGGTLTKGVPEAVRLLNANFDTFCSGVFITQRVILTAAHCALLHPAYIETDTATMTVQQQVKGYYANPQYQANAKSYNYVNDVGLLDLGVSVPTSWVKARNISFDTNPPAGTRMTIVTYGPTKPNGPLGKRNFIYFTWPDQTGAVLGGDSGGPVIRGDTGAIVRIVGGQTTVSGTRRDLLVPLNASQEWLTKKLRELSN